MSFILAIDQGTTGTTCVLVDCKTFKFVDKINMEFPQHYPKPGWVEHNLDDIWNTIEQIVPKLLSKNNIQGTDIEAIGITNQRETTCAFKRDGTPLANAIVWQDRRTQDYCASLKEKGLEETIHQKSGLPIDPYFSASKMRWFLDNNEAVKQACGKDDLLFGTIDTFLLYKLTGISTFAMEATNASRTLLMNLKTCQWDPELLSIFEINESLLPEIKDSFGTFGKTRSLTFLPDGIPITGILGDQQAALFGQAGYKEGDIKCTYGTGSFIVLNTGQNIKTSENGLLSTLAYKSKNKTFYALEGSSYIAGAAVQWLRDNMGIISSSPEVEELALRVTNLEEMKNILFFPFFTGLGSPYWKSDAKAAIIGLTRDSNKFHISRACLEGVTLSINDILECMSKETGIKLSELKVDGGAVQNELLMNIQATFSNLNIIRPEIIETTAYGAALGAAVGNNTLSFEEIHKLWDEDKVFKVDNNHLDYYNDKKSLWSNTLKKLYL